MRQFRSATRCSEALAIRECYVSYVDIVCRRFGPAYRIIIKGQGVQPQKIASYLWSIFH